MAGERQRIRDEQAAAREALLAVGKCVVSVGPRRPRAGLLTADDVDRFNGTQAEREAVHPGGVHDARYAA